MQTDICILILATLNYFTFHSKYFTWITLPTLLFLNYFTLFTSVDVLCFSNLQSFEFSKSNNGLASLSLAQLSPSLLTLFDQLCDFVKLPPSRRFSPHQPPGRVVFLPLSVGLSGRCLQAVEAALALRSQSTGWGGGGQQGVPKKQ